MQIKPIKVWKNGALKTAEELYCRSSDDDFKTAAVIYYELRTAEKEDAPQEILASGNVDIKEDEYAQWGANGDANKDVFSIVAKKLNLTIL